MTAKTMSKAGPRSFQDIVNERADTRIERCYQCGKCASSCPMISHFDHPPYGILRLITLGKKEKALNSKTIWLCTSCYACMTRCPNDINITKVLDVLKQISQEEEAKCMEKNVLTFHKMFLEEVKKYGRINEVRLLTWLKMKTLNFFKDLGLGIKMFKKKKFTFTPEIIKEVNRLREIMR